MANSAKCADGAAIRAYLQRAYGYSATGESREHIINFLTGTGRNGKSVERNAILHVLGDYGYSLPFEAIEAVRGVRQSNDLAPLHRKRMAVSSEANRGVRLDTRRLKALTGEDPIMARFLYSEYFEFLNTATIWVAVNDKPTVPDDSDGFWSRMRAIHYPVMFDNASADPTLKDTFANEEAIGVLAWLVRGATAYYETGLGGIPESIQNTTQAYREENDPVNEFIEAKCARHADAHATFNDVYREYLAWALQQGLNDRETLPRKAVRDYFKAHFRAWRNESGRGFGGIRLLSQEAPATLGFGDSDENPATPAAGDEAWQEASWWEA